MTVAALPHTEPEQWKIPDSWLHASKSKSERIKAVAPADAVLRSVKETLEEHGPANKT